MTGPTDSDDRQDQESRLSRRAGIGAYTRKLRFPIPCRLCRKLAAAATTAAHDHHRLPFTAAAPSTRLETHQQEYFEVLE